MTVGRAMTSQLDQPETYTRLDPSRMRDRIAGLPDQCRRAWQECLTFPLPTACAAAQSVVLRIGDKAVARAELPIEEGLLEEADYFNQAVATPAARQRMRLFLEQGGQTREVELELDRSLAEFGG